MFWRRTETPVAFDEYADRLDAGEKLAAALEAYRGTDAVVLGMARGGVAVGYAVARALGLPLEALVVRKVGAPGNPELAIGAVSETGRRWIDPVVVRATGTLEQYIDREVAAQIEEARRRQEMYGATPEDVRGKVAIVVDDGIATGSSALVAVWSARDLGARRTVLATPAASPQAAARLREQADEVVVLQEPDPFLAVGLYYRRFDQVSDEEVKHYLRDSAEPEP